MSSASAIYDAIIVGSGPAGLSAALGLSRVRRTNLVLSIPNVRRNLPAHEMHNVLTRDGTPPAQFLLTAKQEILTYGFTRFENGKAVSAKKVDDNFCVTLEDGRVFTGRKLLIATGSKDLFPDVEGFANFWGTKIFHCPFCHGWEHKDTPAAALGANMDGYMSATSLSTLASERYFFPNTESADSIPEDIKKKLVALHASGVKIMPYKKIVKVSEDTSGHLVIHLSDGSTYTVAWVLYKPKTALLTPELAADLGLGLTSQGDIKIEGMFQQTTVPGVFAAGDCATMVKQIATAVSQGAAAGLGIHFTLATQDAERAAKLADK